MSVSSQMENNFHTSDAMIDPALASQSQPSLSAEGNSAGNPIALHSVIEENDASMDEASANVTSENQNVGSVLSSSRENFQNAVAGPSTYTPDPTLVSIDSVSFPAVTSVLTIDMTGNLVSPVPPRGPFISRKVAEESVRAFALANNFDIIVTHSDVHRHVVTLSCVRGGRYRCTRGPGHEQLRQRGKRTGKTGCQWRVTLRDEDYKPPEDHQGPFYVQEDMKESWIFTPVTDLINTHNHPPILPKDNPKARHRTITPKVKELIYREMIKGIPTRQIWEKLQKEYPNCLASLVDVKNIIGRKKKELSSI
nr:hypothetical protein L204_05511 [Cryptococcus depauperatus CBS 7855]